MSKSNLPHEWHSWLETNLQRGCLPQELVEIMHQNGFDLTMIEQAMGEHYPDNAAAMLLGSKPHVDYQRLAQLPIGDAFPELVVKPFQNDLVQLFTIENFLSAEACEGLIQLAEDHLYPSKVTHSNGDDAFRTSETCDFVGINSSLLASVDQHIAEALGIRPEYSEALQVQRYSVGQEFKAHHDYFHPNTDVYKEFAGTLGQRTWTFMVYLNSTPKGGGTKFVDLDHTFYPKQGMAVVWNNLTSEGIPNPHTMHHGMPVEEGKKVIITKWFRENGQGDMFFQNTAALQKAA